MPMPIPRRDPPTLARLRHWISQSRQHGAAAKVAHMRIAAKMNEIDQANTRIARAVAAITADRHNAINAMSHGDWVGASNYLHAQRDAIADIVEQNSRIACISNEINGLVDGGLNREAVRGHEVAIMAAWTEGR